MTTKTTILVPAKKYEDSDNCLTDAAVDVAEERGLELWQVEARWEDDQRDNIEVTITA